LINVIPDILAMSFMALFPEMRDDPSWLRLCAWVGGGKPTPMLNLAVMDNGKIVGLFPCEAYKDRIIIHACFLPDFRGDFAVKSSKEAFHWIFANTDYNTITAYIEPEHVKAYARRCGMVENCGLFEVYR